MKTKKEVIQEHPEYKKIIDAVISRVGMDSVEDINRHGIDGGYRGFILYEDTVKFAIKYRTDIVQMLEDNANNLSEDIVAMILSFGYFRNNKADAEDKREIYRYLSGSKCKEHTIPNLMAWYAAETVCRWFED